jgi:ABC-type microcin C transport system permease subunit YejB
VGSYLIRRFLLMVLTLFGMSVLIFVMLRLVPGNIADILVDASGSDPKEKAKIARELGIDRPIAEQYVNWIGGLAHGDLGFAYVSERPAIEEIAPRIPISAKLAGMAILISVLLGGLQNAGYTLQGADFPSGLVGVMQGLILFCALGCELLRRYRVRIVGGPGHEPPVAVTEPAS